MHKMRITAVFATASLLALAGCEKQPAAGNENASAQTAAASADSISGTWKADINSVQFDQKPDDYLLKDGQYSCKSCGPPYSVAADGAFHPVKLPYADEMAVKVVDDRKVTRTSKKGGREVGGTTMAVSADGNTLTASFTDSSVANSPPTKGEITETRVGPAPAGAHAVSGQWKPGKLANFNAEALTVTYKLEGDTLHMSAPSGVSFAAKLGGPDVPIKGDIAGTTASVVKSGDSYVETDKRDGKVVWVGTFTVGSDGRLNVVGEDKLSGTTTRWSATKE